MLRSNKKVHPEGEGKMKRDDLVSNSMNALSPSEFEEKGKEEEETYQSLPTSNVVWTEHNVEFGLQSENNESSKFNSDFYDVEMGKEFKSDSKSNEEESDKIGTPNIELDSFIANDIIYPDIENSIINQSDDFRSHSSTNVVLAILFLPVRSARIAQFDNKTIKQPQNQLLL